ncbi:MAG: hypothetical protein U0797_08735 [Gemmataceae bacterium]
MRDDLQAGRQPAELVVVQVGELPDVLEHLRRRLALAHQDDALNLVLLVVPRRLAVAVGPRAADGDAALAARSRRRRPRRGPRATVADPHQDVVHRRDDDLADVLDVALGVAEQPGRDEQLAPLFRAHCRSTPWPAGEQFGR